MDFKELDKQLKAMKYAQEVIDSIEIPSGPKFDLSSIENPIYEQNEILKDSLEAIKTTTKLLAKQNEELIKSNEVLNKQLDIMKTERDNAEKESKKSKFHQKLSYIIAFVMFLVALFGIFF